MTRYTVNAWVTVDAWAYVEAETPQDALEQAGALALRDFETGDPIMVDIESVTVDA